MSAQPHSSAIPQISVEELAQSMAESSKPLQLIDVREPEEVAIASIAGFENLPLSKYAEWLNHIHTDFDAEVETLVMCHHGVRSAQMCQWLSTQGFTKVKNITGGIDAYSLAVDAAIPRY